MTTAVLYPGLIGLFDNGATPRNVAAIPKRQQIKLVPGETIKIPLAVFDSAAAAFDLTGWAVIFTLDGQAHKFSREADFDNAALGLVSFQLAIEDTTGWPSGGYTFDAVGIAPDGSQEPFVVAQIAVLSAVAYVSGDPVTVLPSQTPLGQGPQGIPGPEGPPGTIPDPLNLPGDLSVAGVIAVLEREVYTQNHNVNVANFEQLRSAEKLTENVPSGKAFDRQVNGVSQELLDEAGLHMVGGVTLTPGGGVLYNALQTVGLPASAYVQGRGAGIPNPLQHNVPTGAIHKWSINGVSKMTLDATNGLLINGSPVSGGGSVQWLKATYGAVGNGTIDDSAALQALLTAMQATPGVYGMEPGIYRVRSPVSANAIGTNSTTSELFGYGSGTTLLVDLTDITQNAITLNHTGSNTVRTKLSNFVLRSPLVASTGQRSSKNALHLLGAAHDQYVLNGVDLYGVSTGEANLLLEGGCHFISHMMVVGCLAGLTTGGGTGVIHCQACPAVELFNVHCEDVGSLNGFNVAGANAGYWVAFDPGPSVPYSQGTLTAQSFYRVINCHFDEVPAFSIMAYPFSGNRGRHLYVKNSRSHCSSTTGGKSIRAQNFDFVTVEDCWLGYANNNDPIHDGVSLFGVGRARISRNWFTNFVTRVSADSACGVLECDENIGLSTIASSATKTLVRSAGGLTVNGTTIY